MTITLTPPNGTATTLCSGDERKTDGTPFGASDVTSDETPGSALREFVGADRVQGEHVGCDRGTLTFRTTRIFATVAAASAWAIAGHRAEAKAGALKVTVGGTTTTVFENCAVVSKRISQVGVAVVTQYTIEG